ncbi:hypothetical protein GOBAR_AA10118 [Gossypium barbadense]|uniref:Eukaryotic translation initiation factor 5B n=1 Tax=Gossypium barbadense TaxID=3634 RepID=A0A2P5Y4K9_GOSBA|nr:hypothetical protein GOBAR_AA10118 [Gossypium barbadense]
MLLVLGTDQKSEIIGALKGKKKKSKGGKKGGNRFAAAALDEFDGEFSVKVDEMKAEEEDVPSISFSDKKKKSKSSKKSGKAIGGFTATVLDELGDEEGAKEDVEDDVPVFPSSDKKKKSKSSKKVGNPSSAPALDELESDSELKEHEEDDVPSFSFSDKKKKSKSKPSKKSGNSFSAALLDDEDEGDASVPESTGAAAIDDYDDNTSMVAFSGKKKKSSKKKSSAAFAALGDEAELQSEVSDMVETELSSLGTRNIEAVDSKTNNKSEEAGPAVTKPITAAPPQEEKAQVQPEPEPEPVIAADATGEKEAAAAVKEEETKTETSDAKKKDAKSKAADKKLPKHVREMQEALARRKEAEERKKKEEEERLRKEEEERRRQEELERQAEEAKRRKKEREKEKLLKKKQEGKLLTGKQKEEARRREAMRNQILANAGGLSLPTADKEGAPTKRPIYQTKKSKSVQHANGAASTKPEENTQSKAKEQEESETKVELESVDDEKVDEVESNNTEDKSGAFDDEEADSVPKPAVQKDIKSAPLASRNAAPPAVAKPMVEAKKPVTSQSNTSQPEVKSTDKNLKKNTAVQNKVPKSDASPKQSEDLRSPICCIMGHVDTGKTKLLDCIRGTNVQEGEAGGITQQIGATYFPAANIRERTKELKADATLKVPGLLVIDTPGHESFTNLRSRGSGLCDIAILVVDIMHGLEPQTIESLNLLKMRKTEFIIALNKVDRLYDWKARRNSPIGMTLKKQTKDVLSEFNRRVTYVITQFKEQGLNTELYYKNKEMGETFSIVPTSAVTGEGIPDLLLLLVQWTQKTMVEKLTFSDEVQCTVLEVKVIEGLGTTIDVVLVNGVLHEGDQIVGPIVTTIRALLTPHPMKEIRVKGAYMQHKEIKAAQGIKIAAQGLEHAIAGTSIYVVGPDDDLEDIKEAAKEDMQSVMSRIDKSGEGVYVQASTLGSLEALLEFLKTPEVNIPVSGIGLGPVHKKDVMKASVMLEKKNEYATILAFDVKVTPEARELADELGVRIFIADIIYHLFDQFKAYIDGLKEERKREAADEAVFPCVLKILPNCIFNKKDPIVLGVDILEGILRVGTPICIPQREFIDIGRIASIENNHKPVDSAKKGQKVAIKIVGSNTEEQQKMYGRHFELEDELVSHISRRSIDILKANYRVGSKAEDPLQNSLNITTKWTGAVAVHPFDWLVVAGVGISSLSLVP